MPQKCRKVATFNLPTHTKVMFDVQTTEENRQGEALSSFGRELDAHELRALRLWATELKQSAVADTMGISTRQAERLFRKIKNKLGAKNAVQVGMIAARRGLLK